MGHVSENVINDAFRGYLDDVAGGIASQTPIELVDTNWTQDTGSPFHVAMLVTETAGGAANNYSYTLQYNLNGAGWNDVTLTSPIQSTTPVNCTTTNAASYGTTALTTGATIQETEYDTSGTSASNVTLTSSSFEQTSCLLIDSAQVSTSDTIQLRLTNAGTALTADTTIPTITANVPAQVVTGTHTSNTSVVTSSASGSVLKTVTGTHTSTTPLVTSQATGAREITGTSATTSTVVTSSASGGPSTGVSGSHSSSITIVSSLASGTVEKTGTHTATITPLVSAASGTITKTGTGAGTTATTISSASGFITKVGTGATTAPSVTSSASGSLGGSVSGTHSASVASVTSSSSGLVESASITGTHSASTSLVTSASLGVIKKVATSSNTSPRFISSSSGTINRVGSGAIFVRSVTSLASGSTFGEGDAKRRTSTDTNSKTSYVMTKNSGFILGPDVSSKAVVSTRMRNKVEVG